MSVCGVYGGDGVSAGGGADEGSVSGAPSAAAGGDVGRSLRSLYWGSSF
jgi:hypothetical protein